MMHQWSYVHRKFRLPIVEVYLWRSTAPENRLFQSSVRIFKGKFLRKCLKMNQWIVESRRFVYYRNFEINMKDLVWCARDDGNFVEYYWSVDCIRYKFGMINWNLSLAFLFTMEFYFVIRLLGSHLF